MTETERRVIEAARDWHHAVCMLADSLRLPSAARIEQRVKSSQRRLFDAVAALNAESATDSPPHEPMDGGRA